MFDIVFQEASPANLISYNHAISGLGRSGHWQIALELVMAPGPFVYFAAS
jgi:hypothetical protein